MFTCELYQIFKNTYFAEDLQTAASEMFFLSKRKQMKP